MYNTTETIRVGTDGAITRGMKVPHRAANIPCGAFIGYRTDSVNGEVYEKHCRKRVGHPTAKGTKRHKRVDYRIIAASPMVVHSQRFVPNVLPRGVDQSIGLPHDCANHLPDTEEVLRRGW